MRISYYNISYYKYLIFLDILWSSYIIIIIIVDNWELKENLSLFLFPFECSMWFDIN